MTRGILGFAAAFAAFLTVTSVFALETSPDFVPAPEELPPPDSISTLESSSSLSFDAYGTDDPAKVIEKFRESSNQFELVQRSQESQEEADQPAESQED
jgi:hypothetical protein